MSLRLFLCHAAALMALALIPAGCHAQPGQPSSARGETRTLQSFGALGDGHADDTAALVRAFGSSERYCLDGQGRSYHVSGTLRAGQSLCLRNATLVQTAAPVDTAPYITRRCPVVANPSGMTDCGDPSVPADQFARLAKSLSVRTLFIRPNGSRPVEVTLDHVKIDRGPFAEGGSRSDSAGIWLDQADRVDFRNVEITGNRKGYGLLITNSRNVTLTSLWIHDLAWAPYRGDAPLTQSKVAAIGWNSVPIHELREGGRGGAGASKFYGVRIQEQITCASLQNVTHVRIESPRVERCMARFDTGNLPWQADGLDIGRSSSDVVIEHGRIDSTWEGMDIVAGGQGIDSLTINDMAISNSFGFGLKLGYQLRNAQISGLKVTGAGIAGVVIYGPVRHLHLTHATIGNLGVVRGSRGNFSPWPRGNRAGIRLDEGSNGDEGGTSTPDDVALDDLVVSGQPSDYEFGILNTGAKHVQAAHLRASGYGSQLQHGIQ